MTPKTSFSGIYQILNAVNGKRYIGSAVHFGKRWNLHKSALRRGVHHNEHLQRAWLKHGETAFSFVPIMLCGLDDLMQWERKYLDDFRPEYNAALDPLHPMLGRKHTAETRAKQSLAKIGIPRSEEMRAKLVGNKNGIGNKSNTGRSLTPEHKAKVSASLIGNSRRTGIQHTEETRRKISLKGKGRPWSAKRRAALENSH